MGNSSIPVVCLMGPTATGKTDAAAQLMRDFDAQIISVDSSLVYQGMNIGTAKPDADFLARYPHHLVDIKHPNEPYSVAQFYDDCRPLIEQITAQGKLPVLAGGTMFYFNALEYGLHELPQANATLRAQILSDAKQFGWQALHQRLNALDPDSARRIEPGDTQRVQRALEIVIQSGKPVAQHNNRQKPAIANPLLKVALAFSDRTVLHQRIEQRFDLMLEAGLQREVETLLADGVSAQASSMRMIGYRQMLDFLHNNLTYQQMRDKGVAATRQLAKRQLTWLRNQANVIWWMDFGLQNKEFHSLSQLIRNACIARSVTSIGAKSLY